MGRKNVAVMKPESVTSAIDAGKVLKHWMKTNNNPRTKKRWTLDELAVATGISRTTLGHYLSGHRDLRKITQPIAQKLLPVLGMTDKEFWAMFAVPPERQNEVRVIPGIPSKSDQFVEIRLEGSPDEVRAAARALAKVFKVVKESRLYPNRGGSVFVRQYLDVRLIQEAEEEI